ncbi:hypothetical protein ACQJBY_036683 [Aegilops geniculata]
MPSLCRCEHPQAQLKKSMSISSPCDCSDEDQYQCSEVLASLNLARTATYGLQQQRFCSLRSSAPMLIFSLLFSYADVHEHCAAQFYVVLRISIND